MPKPDELLDFAECWKTRHQIRARFDLSNSSSFRLLRFLEKGNYLIKRRLKVEGHKNKIWFYKKK